MRFCVMISTAIIGIIVEILFAVNVDVESLAFLVPLVFYPVEWLVVSIGFKWKFKKNSVWVATLSSLPGFIALIGFLITESFDFLKWYSFIGITISALIFEYKYFGKETTREK